MFQDFQTKWFFWLILLTGTAVYGTVIGEQIKFELTDFNL